jgi:nucleotide-binding universal stress UspA family protein
MRFLAGIDPSGRPDAVLHLAAILARSAGAALDVAAIHPKSWPPFTPSVDADWHTSTRESASDALNQAARVLAGSDVEAEYILAEASSGRRGLLQLVEERGSSLIVVGSSSAGPYGYVALGSENDALLHASPIPVAIAPRGYRSKDGARVTRVTAAYSGTDAAADLVIGAAGIAGEVGASLRIASFAVLRSVANTAGTTTQAERRIVDTWAGDVEAHAAAVLAKVSSLPHAPTVEGTVVGVGETWASAIEDIGWHNADVLVVGSSSLGPISRVFLGSHAAKVVRHSPVPVVVVPRRGVEALAEPATRG